MAVEQSRWGILYCPKHDIFFPQKRWEKIEKCLKERGIPFDKVQSENSGSVERLCKMMINNGYRTIIIGVDIDREERRKRISERLKQRLDEGMADEVRRLLDEGIAAEDLIYYGLEYKYVTEYVVGQTTYDEMFRRLEIAIHQFAKRQMTWFRGMERRGFTIHWMDSRLPMAERVREIVRLAQTS